MRMIFLIPPSEWKNPDGKNIPEKLSFHFQKPLQIAENATEKDLKCSGGRYTEAIFLNKNIGKSVTLSAILRYNGVLFSHLNYETLPEKSQKFFDTHVYILSGMYGIMKPKDQIGNYKLPIETRGLYQFWENMIAEKIIAENPDFIINLLPKSYEKLLNIRENLSILQEKNIVIINIHFIKKSGEKISHNSKIHRWKFLRNICENEGKNFFEQNIQKISENIWEIYHIIDT